MRTSKTRSTALRRVCLGISQLFGAAQAQAGNGKGAIEKVPGTALQT